MKSVDTKLQKEIERVFPEDLIKPIIDGDGIGGTSKFSDKYSDFIISIYDHRLSTDEADDQIISYIIEDKSIRSLYFEKEHMYMHFFESLFQLTPVYKITISDSCNVLYLKYNNIEEFLEECKKSLQEVELSEWCLPVLEAIVVGSYDMECIVYFRNRYKIKKLMQLAIEAGLVIR